MAAPPIRTSSRRELRVDFVLGVLLVSGAVALWIYMQRLAPDARTLPFIVVVGLGGGGLGLIGKTALRARRMRRTEQAGPEDRGARSWATRTVALIRIDEIVTLLLIVLYALALTRIGFFIASAIAMVAAAVLLRLPRWAGWSAYCIGFLLFTQWLFFDYLNLRDLGWSPL